MLVKSDEHGDGMQCGGEIIVEYDVWQEGYKTGKRICQYCEEYEDNLKADVKCHMLSLEEDAEQTEHSFVDEWDERDCWEFVSLKTYCWHVITKEQVQEVMDDEAVASAERRAEGR